MRRLLTLALFTLLTTLSALGQGTLLRRQGRCESGGQQAVIQGLISTGTVPTGSVPPLAPVGAVMASYPGCQVDVYYTGTSNHAPIFSDNLTTPTVLGNPFNASTLTGAFGFYAAPSTSIATCYDITTSGAGMPTPYTDSYVCLGGSPGSGGGSGVASVSFNPLSVNFGTVQTVTSNPPTLPLTISNTSTQSVLVNGVTVPGPDFSLPFPTLCNGPLNPLAGCTLPVQANPTSAGAKIATATLSTSAPIDPSNPLTVTLNATGTGATTALVTLVGQGLGGGTVTDGGTLIANFSPPGPCTGVCQLSYPIGTVLTLTAAADVSSQFTSFQGAGLSASPGTFTVTGPQTITVTFDPAVPDVTVSLVAVGQGSGTVQSDAVADNGLGALKCVSTAGVQVSGGGSGCNGPFPSGSPIVLTATAGATSQFVTWAGVPGCGVTNVCTFTPTANTTVTANFSTSSSTSQISLTQVFANANVSGTTVSKAFGSAQLAGDINICALTVPDAVTTVASFVDSVNGAYTQVPTISPKVGTGLTQAVYYFQNIAAANAGANTVTVTLSTSAASSLVGSALASDTFLSAGTSVTTSTTPTLPNNNLILATFWGNLNAGNGVGAMSSVTGCSLTWVLVSALSYGTTVGTGKSGRTEVWRALGNGSSCAITGNYSTTPTGRAVSVSGFSGVDTSGSNGSGAVGIIATNLGGGTVASVTMGTFGSASNGTFAAVTTNTGVAMTPSAGMTALNATSGHDRDEWAAGNITTPGFTFASSNWGEVGIEIKSSGGSGRRDIRCLEYAGIKQTGGTPIDVSAAAVGTSAAPSSGGVTTTVTNDLLTGFTASSQSVNAVSPNYTQQIKNSFGDDAEDRQGVIIGTYPFTPTLLASGNWIASQVAWLAQSTTAPTTFSLTLLPSPGNGGGTVASNIGNPTLGGIVSPTGCFPATNSGCSSAVPANSTVTLTATPNQGAVFVGWVGITGCTSSAICIIPNITANQNIIANFALAGGQTIFVSTSGSDSNNGLSLATAYRHISKAIAVFNNTVPTTILVHAGTYSDENINCTGYSAAVCLNRGGSTSTIRLKLACDTQWSVPSSTGCLLRNPSGDALVAIAANNTDIGALNQFGFDMSNPNLSYGIVGPNCNLPSGTVGQCSAGQNVSYLGNYLHDISSSIGVCEVNPNGHPAMTGQNHHGPYQVGFKIIGNRITNIGNQALSRLNGGPGCINYYGMYVTGQVVIENNLLANIAGYGIHDYSSPCQSVISGNDISRTEMPNIIVGGGDCNYGVAQGNVTVSNNILGQTAPGQSHIVIGVPGGSGIGSSGHTILVSNNLFGTLDGNTQVQIVGTNFTTVQGSLTEAPTATYVTYTGGNNDNFQLQSTSVAVNGGTTQCVAGGQTPCTPSTDFLNLPRPQRTTLDRGAYELP